MALVQTLSSAGPMSPGGGGGGGPSGLVEPPLVAASAPAAPAQPEPEEPVIDIVINNVVSSFSVSCHLDLKHIAQNGHNVEYRRENGMVTMKMRRPYTTASMWSSGKITCTGSTSEAEARVAARRVARYLQKELSYPARFRNFRVVNVLGTCTMPFSIKIADFSQKYPRIASYEPELHPGVTYRINHLKATLKVFSTGSITVTAPSVSAVQQAIEHIFPLVYEFRKDKSPEEAAAAAAARARQLADSDLELDDSSDGSDD
ncbi:TATA box-binding protein-like 1 isoform X2 [Amphibalanus amphitrite]|uniref:TATA box-binding protein-like 1 isoform X2 n=1 Tax=Amphibalanus amphitrite TaxID=1232801 RepID=UPI001C907F85|nr:TATA box-binding protein-like 1 isoform X2 [Amphibalanus amphitrite]XP_043228613.1 TATA box-binding protein-like 1 isoform X2 [Amphibalanus amphitrite]